MMDCHPRIAGALRPQAQERYYDQFSGDHSRSFLSTYLEDPSALLFLLAEGFRGTWRMLLATGI